MYTADIAGRWGTVEQAKLMNLIPQLIRNSVPAPSARIALLRHPAHTPNYENTEDFLFIPYTHSARRFVASRPLSTALSGVGLLGMSLILSTLFLTHPLLVMTAIVVWLNAILIVFKLVVMAYAGRSSFTPVSKKEIQTITDAELPRYTIFVPLLEEAEVMPQILRALCAIDYPTDKLEVFFTFEKYDHATIAAFRRANPPAHFKEIILPDCAPKSKPKALNVALLQATGEFFVIFDAEIIPDPDQLKHAVLAFRKSSVASLQTRLEHYNASENALTRLFNMEFACYYDFFLPGLQRLGFPIPLSGHSVHLRASAVRAVGGWDPYNMAEDCDLGVRLFRHGFRTGMINSMSREEAVAGSWAWTKQRTRWMKGFIQSSVVHLQHPIRFAREIGGVRNFLAFLFLVPGTVFFNLLNFFSWFVLLAWLLFQPSIIQSFYPGLILTVAVVTFVLGSIAFVYFNLVAAYYRGRYEFVKYGLLTPFYWMLLSFATMRAIAQFFTSPHTWEKTHHGANNHLKLL